MMHQKTRVKNLVFCCVMYKTTYNEKVKTTPLVYNNLKDVYRDIQPMQRSFSERKDRTGNVTALVCRECKDKIHQMGPQSIQQILKSYAEQETTKRKHPPHRRERDEILGPVKSNAKRTDPLPLPRYITPPPVRRESTSGLHRQISSPYGTVLARDSPNRETREVDTSLWIEWVENKLCFIWIYAYDEDTRALLLLCLVSDPTY